MIICDKCKQNKPTHIVYFGGYMLEKSIVPNWDLCNECEKILKETLEKEIGTEAKLKK